MHPTTGGAVTLAVAVLAAACSQADLFPITRGASTGGAAGVGDAGRSGSGAIPTGGAGSSIGGGGGAVTGGGGGAFTGGGGAPACAGQVVAPGDSNRSIMVAGKARTYVLHVPATNDGSKPVPLVVDFHGIGQSGAKERASSPYPTALDPEGVVMAFPDGLKGPAGNAWNVGPCCVANVDDVAFARALVADVQGLTCVDAARVYAVGVLTGGGMAHYLACHAADVFAAAAPAAFDLLSENVGDCAPLRPVSVISFRGTADTRVPYDGGPSSLVPGMPLTFLGATGTFEKWSELDQCVGPASPPDSHNCSAYSGCANGVEVILCTQDGGGEDPGDPSVAWPVLKRHTL